MRITELFTRRSNNQNPQCQEPRLADGHQANNHGFGVIDDFAEALPVLPAPSTRAIIRNYLMCHQLFDSYAKSIAV
jgi:hypothetical protein